MAAGILVLALIQDAAWERIKPFFTPPPEFAGQLGDFKPVLVDPAVPWKTRRKELLEKWTGLLGAWPPVVEKPTLKAGASERVENFTRWAVEVQVAPDRTTAGFLLVPDGAGPFPAVVDVFYHPRDGAGLTPAARQQNDFGYQLARRGLMALCIGQDPGIGADKPIYYPGWTNATLQPLSYLAYVAATARGALATRPDVDPARIGVVGHSYGGKWAMFAGALCEQFAAVAISDPGIVFDESRPNVNYWEPWYLGYEAGKAPREKGVPNEKRLRTGPYARMIEEKTDLHELHALIAPRPFFVAGGSEDPPERWRALNHAVAVNTLLGFEGRVGMSNRKDHKISPEAGAQIADFFEHFIGKPAGR